MDGGKFDRVNVHEVALGEVVAHGGAGTIRFCRVADAAGTWGFVGNIAHEDCGYGHPSLLAATIVISQNGARLTGTLTGPFFTPGILTTLNMSGGVLGPNSWQLFTGTISLGQCDYDFELRATNEVSDSSDGTLTITVDGQTCVPRGLISCSVGYVGRLTR